MEFNTKYKEFKLEPTKEEGATISNIDEMLEEIEKHVYSLIESGELKVLYRGNKSSGEFQKEFWREFDKLEKEKKQLIKRGYKYLFSNPMQFIYEFEIILTKMSMSGVYSDEYVDRQRTIMYDKMNNPTPEVREWVDKARKKLNI